MSTKVHVVKAMVFSSGHVWMWELEYKESWAPKNWCFWAVVLEKTLESLLDCKEIQPVHPKGNQSSVFIGRTDVEAETPVFWPADVKSWLIWKDPDAGKDLRWEEKGTTEDEMIEWHHWLYGHGFGWTPGVGDAQGGLACCGSWGHKVLDMTERLNWTELHIYQEFLIRVIVWQKPLRYCKVISLQLIKINEKKNLLLDESYLEKLFPCCELTLYWH